MNQATAMAENVLNGILIPPCPATLSAVMREANRSAADLSRLASLIGQDAGLVGPLLKLANSPFVGLRSPVSSIMQAVSVLGMQNTINLVQNISLRQSVGGGQTFDKFWERSSLTASIAEKLARKFPNVSKDDALIAALFHDCGIPVLIMKFPEYRSTVMAHPGRAICEVEYEVFSTSHAVVGSMLTRSWMLPAQVSKAIQLHHESSVFNGMEGEDDTVLDLIGIIHMAECVTDEHLHVRDKEWDQVGAAVLAHFDLSEQEFSELKGDILAYLNGE